MSLPDPKKALVIQYEYTWAEQAERGQEARKSRPCMVFGVQPAQDEKPGKVAILPITSSPPTDQSKAVSIPEPIGKTLGLPKSSWLVINEGNMVKAWPQGLVPVPSGAQKGKFSYGYMPAGFFKSVYEKTAEQFKNKKFKSVSKAGTDLNNPEYRKGRPAELRTDRARQLAEKIKDRQSRQDQDKDRSR